MEFSEDFVNMMEDYDLYTPEGVSLLSYIDQEELEKVFKSHPAQSAILFMVVANFLTDQYSRAEKLFKDNEALRKELEDLKDKVLEKQWDDRYVHVG